MEEFVDFCILCGCDYLPTIQGLGPGNALKLIREHKTLEKIIEHIQEENQRRISEGEKPRFLVPENFDFQTTRELFFSPNTTENYPQFQISNCQREEFKKFMVDQKSFDPQRVESILERLEKSRRTKPQMSLENFFGKPQVQNKKIEKSLPRKRNK